MIHKNTHIIYVTHVLTLVFQKKKTCEREKKRSGGECYKKLLADEKQRLVKYINNYSIM